MDSIVSGYVAGQKYLRSEVKLPVDCVDEKLNSPVKKKKSLKDWNINKVKLFKY